MTTLARTLSSAQTVLMKIIFPVVWIAGFGFGTLLLWTGAMHGVGGEPPPWAMKWQFLCIWVAGSAFILWGCAGLKKVRLDGSCLYVSNYRREIKVPLTSIASVTENRWINIHPVTIHFRVPTEFGRKITFMPKVRFFTWGSHPVVGELRHVAGLQGAHAV